MKTRTALRKLLPLWLAVLLLLSSALPGVSAATVTKVKKTYDIAVAFDNSGSMYENTNAWCHAKYAMEIFASMLDYSNGDKLTIFPMYDVTTDGSTDKSNGTKLVEIRSKGDIDKIHKLYTPYAGGTPFEPVNKARDYLKASSASEKWLVVLTDGQFQSMSQDKTRKALLAIANSRLRVQYLGVGSAAYPLQASESQYFYADKAATSGDLQNKLIDICNKIFQRNELKGRLSGQTVTLDISMNKLIVFAQGQQAKILSLKDSSGKEIPLTMDSGQRTYSKLGCGNYANAKVDTSLAGQVVTFGSCPAGTYTLTYSGTDKLQIFYEPDVDMEVKLLNSDGQAEDFSDGEIPPGEYTYQVRIVDAVTGKDVTANDLLGGNVNIASTITYPGQPATQVKNGDKITLTPGENIDVKIVGSYLKDYKITNEDDPSIFPLNIRIPQPKNELTVTAAVEQTGAWYQLSRHNSWKPIRLTLAVNGQPMTDEELAAAKLEVYFTGQPQTSTLQPAYKLERLPGQSAVNVYIGTDDKGNYVKPAAGSYTLVANASAIDQYGKEMTASASADFSVRRTPIWMWWALLALALAVLVFIAGLPAKPAKLFIVNDDTGSVKGPMKIKSNVVIKCVADTRERAFAAKARTKKSWGSNSWLKNILRSQTMTFYLTDVAFSEDRISNLTIASGECNINEDGKVVNSISGDGRFEVYHNASVSWTETDDEGESELFNGRFRINKRN